MLPPALHAALQHPLTTPLATSSSAVVAAASPDPLPSLAALTSCLAVGLPCLLAPSQRLTALAALWAGGGRALHGTLRRLRAGGVGRLALSPAEAALVDALLEGGDAAAAALATPLEAALAWRGSVPRGGEAAGAPTQRDSVPAPILVLPPPRALAPDGDRVWATAEGVDEAAPPPSPAAADDDADAAPLADLLRRAAAGVLPPADWALAKRLAEARTSAAAAAASAAAAGDGVAAGVAAHMPALAGLATLAAADADGGYGDEGSGAHAWASALLAGAPVSHAWASAVASVATGPHAPPAPLLRAALARALQAVPADPAAPDAARAARLAALLARTLRGVGGGAGARAALEPLRPELEAFALAWSRVREAADLYRDLKADGAGEDG